MKTKNQTEQSLLELAAAQAANDDEISPEGSGDATAAGRKQGWSPFEVWLTRVKSPSTQAVREGATV